MASSLQPPATLVSSSSNRSISLQLDPLLLSSSTSMLSLDTLQTTFSSLPRLLCIYSTLHQEGEFLLQKQFGVLMGTRCLLKCQDGCVVQDIVVNEHGRVETTATKRSLLKIWNNKKAWGMDRMHQRRKRVLHPWIVSMTTLQVQLLNQDDGHNICDILWSFVIILRTWTCRGRTTWSYDDGTSNLCLIIGASEGSDQTLIGNFQQQNIHIVYDLESNKLVFVPAQCDKL